MTQTAPHPAEAPTSGMFAPFETGEPLAVLEEAGSFVVVDGAVREGIKTEFGERQAFDLKIATTKPGALRTVSGFSAGIVGQLRRRADGDLPAVCRLTEQDTGKGNPTKVLVLVERIPAGADPGVLAAAAEALPVPMRPLAQPSNEIPY